MTTLTLTQTQTWAAPRGAFSLAGPIAVAAGLVALAALWFLASALQAMPQAGAVDTRTTLHTPAIPSVQASRVPHGGTTVPDASQVFAGRETVLEEPAPTF